MPHETETDDWLTWIERCALERCPDATRNHLKAFLFSRMTRLSQSCAAACGMHRPAPDALTPNEAWHLFESHLVTHDTREGKSYKLWLKDHARLDRSDPLAGLESGATLLARDVAREYLRREGLRSMTLPLDAPLPGRDGNTLRLADLLPAPEDPYEKLDAARLAGMAREACEPILEQLTRREKVVLLARALQLPLTSPDIAAAAGCGKSVLFTTYQESLQTIASHVRRSFASEDRPTCARLAILALQRVQTTLIQWGASQRDLGRLYTRAGESGSSAPFPHTAPAPPARLRPCQPTQPQTVGSW